jgi:DNA-binding NarL/FixJ family response regulator
MARSNWATKPRGSAAEHLARAAVTHHAFGRWGEARACADSLVEVLRPLTQLNLNAVGGALVASMEIACGHADRALADLERQWAQNQSEGEEYLRPFLAPTLVEAMIALGRAAEAIPRIEFAWGLPSLQASVGHRIVLQRTMGVAQLVIGDTVGARRWLEDAVADARQADNSHEEARALRYIGAIDRANGEHRVAESELHLALELHQALGYRQHVADVLEELAGIETDKDRLALAATLFATAAAVREEVGFVFRLGRQEAYERDIAKLDHAEGLASVMSIDEAADLARRGRGDRARPTFGWDSLTPTEKAVAQLVVEGLTNSDIAERLVMGRETVKTHVSNLLRKTGVSNRTQLASALSRRSSEKDVIDGH